MGITINPIPVRNKAIELDVVAKLKNASNDFNIVVNIFYSLYLFFDLSFLSSKFVCFSSMLLVELLKPFTSFLSNRCCISLFSSGADFVESTCFLFRIFSINYTNLPKSNPFPV